MSSAPAPVYEATDATYWRCLTRDQPGAALAAGRASLWVCPRGALEVGYGTTGFRLRAGEAFVCDEQTPLEVRLSNGSRATALGIEVPTARLRQLALDVLDTVPGDPIVFPERLRDARSPFNTTGYGDPILLAGLGATVREHAASACFAEILRNQWRDAARVRLCRGRTSRHRRQMYLRLKRASNRIELDPLSAPSVTDLAALSNLSVWHFIRTFREVFGETPHQYATRHRLAAVHVALMESEDAVCEIAARLGFANRCAFARLFKQHFGYAPSRVRALRRNDGAGDAARESARAGEVDAPPRPTRIP